MKNVHFIYKLAFVLLFAAALPGCRKENGIDNNNVVKRPYSLYFADMHGSLYNTSTGEGESFDLVFPPDGYNPRAILVSGPNLLWVKRNVHLSENNGVNFNPVDSSVTQLAPWQSLILRVPGHNRIYLCAGLVFGLKMSEDNGKTWHVDTLWNISGDPALTHITSLAVLTNGMLFGYDHVGRKLYKKGGRDERWIDVAGNNLPTTGEFYLSRFNNILLLTDYTGAEGVWHSEDEGANWAQYTGLPATKLLTTVAPFDKMLFVGTDSMGLYQLSGNTFTQTNSGMEPNPSVRGIVAKDNIYKNDLARDYIYLSTNYGIYRSEDGGETWAHVFPGNFTAIY